MLKYARVSLQIVDDTCALTMGRHSIKAGVDGLLSNKPQLFLMKNRRKSQKMLLNRLCKPTGVKRMNIFIFVWGASTLSLGPDDHCRTTPMNHLTDPPLGLS